MGPPGVGKGTQSALLAEYLEVVTISTGEMFRQHVRGQTSLGKEVSAIVAAGGLVPDAVTSQMIAIRLDQPDASAGFILDGYPRTKSQARQLDLLLTERRSQLDAVVVLLADDEEIVDRLTQRSSSQGRADDGTEVIRHRIDVYKQETADIADLYRDRGLLATVDGMGAPGDVARRIRQSIA
jgi:adenylate kinase